LVGVADGHGVRISSNVGLSHRDLFLKKSPPNKVGVREFSKPRVENLPPTILVLNNVYNLNINPPFSKKLYDKMIVILESDLESDDETRDEMLARVPCGPPPLVE
jgi:hypothetical protein